MCSLTTNRQAPTMTQAAVAADIHQTLDVHLNALAKVALDLALRFEDGTNPAQLVFAQISDRECRRLTPASLSTELERERPMP